MTKPLPLPPALSVLYQLRHTGDRVGAAISALHTDKTPNQINLLLQLNQPLKIKDLAQIMMCQPSNMTPLVKECEQRGWLEKRRSTEDARTQLVMLTGEGEELRALLIKQLNSIALELSGLTEQDFYDLQQILQRAK